MRIRIPLWVKIVFGGILLWGTLGANCAADALRMWSDQLNSYANEMDGGKDKDFGDVINDVESWFK
ncbi:MAG: hypothetical protein GXY44_15750 [Phycisphaerales bacterium]|nr:hypothetical protein [Phycisphaerales bacterium]